MSHFTTHLKNRNFSRLWVAQVISQFGDRINQMALIGLVAGRAPGSAVELAKVLSFTIIPVFLVGPIAGVYVDRWDRRTTLFVCDFLRALFVISIPFVFMGRGSMVPIYVVVFLVFCLSRFYVPAKMSIIPDLVKEEDLLMANSLVTTTGMIAFVFGCAFGGFLVERLGARGGFMCDAATFFISGIFVFSMSTKMRLKINRAQLLDTGKEMLTDIRKSVMLEMKEGIHYIAGHRDMRFVMGLLFVLFAAAGAVYVVIIVFVQRAFHSVTQDLGVLAVCLGLGLFTGSLAYGRWGQRISRFTTIFCCLILGGVMLLLFTVVVQQLPAMPLAMALAFFLGLVVGPIIISANTVIHQLADGEMRGKVFSFIEAIIHFAFLISMLICSVLAEHVAHSTILITVGGIFAVVGAIGMVSYKTRFQHIRG